MILKCFGMFIIIILYIVSESAVVTSYSMDLNDIERSETSDEEKGGGLTSQTEDVYKSNGIVGRFFDPSHRHSTNRDSKMTNTDGRKKSGIYILHYVKCREYITAVNLEMPKTAF